MGLVTQRCDVLNDERCGRVGTCGEAMLSVNGSPSKKTHPNDLARCCNWTASGGDRGQKRGWVKAQVSLSRDRDAGAARLAETGRVEALGEVPSAEGP